jgi:hypothetical protein
MRKYVLIPIAERFWAKVNKDGPVVRPELGSCWEWMGAIRPNGYGQMSAGRRGQTPLKVHRVAWELAYGAAPTSYVLHRCDNRRCVRPSHLFEGDQATNLRDTIAKGRLDPHASGYRSAMKRWHGHIE